MLLVPSDPLRPRRPDEHLRRRHGPHPDTPNDNPPGDVDLAPLTPSIAALNLPFVTADLALRPIANLAIADFDDPPYAVGSVTVEQAALTAALPRKPG